MEDDILITPDTSVSGAEKVSNPGDWRSSASLFGNNPYETCFIRYVCPIDETVNASKCIVKVRLIAEKLLEKATLPQVQAKMGTLREVLNPVSWENVSMQWLERVRIELRELMKFLVGTRGEWFVVDIEDTISYDGESQGMTVRLSYKQRVMDFLAANRNLPVLDKIYHIEQLTAEDVCELERIMWEELGNKQEYEQMTADRLCGSNVAMFIRSVIGVDRQGAMLRFGEFLTGAELNAEQEEFLATIISYVCENGDITKEIVVNEAPFDEQLVVFENQMLPLARYIDNLHNAIVPVIPYDLGSPVIRTAADRSGLA